MAASLDDAVPENGAWQTVARRGKSRRSNPNTAAQHIRSDVDPAARLAASATKQPIIKNGRLQEPPSTPSQQQSSLAEIDRTYTRIRTTYLSSASHTALEALVRANAASHAPITRAICLGNGPLDAPDSSWDRRRTASVQTATFLALVELLLSGGVVAGNHESKIRCIFQEPLYTSADRTYLTETLGCEVVDAPEALEYVTEDSLVWGVHMYHSVYADILGRVAEPAMLVGTPWDVWDALPPDQDGRAATSLKQLGEINASAEYDLFAFPHDEGHFTFCDTGMYWKKRAPAMAAKEKSHATVATVDENDTADSGPDKTPHC